MSCMNASPSRRSRSMESEVVFSTVISPSRRDSFADDATNLVGRDAFLLQCVTVANRDCAVLHRLAIDRDGERRSDLVLPTVTAADRPRFVVEYWKGTPQLFRQPFGELWHTILLDQGKDPAFTGASDGARPSTVRPSSSPGT